MNRAIIPIFIPHLGCPHQCVFCDQRAIAAPEAPAPSAIPAVVRQAMPWAEGGQLAFYGGSFTAIPAEEQIAYLQAAQPFLQAGLVKSLRISTRPDAIDRSILERLRRYGVRTVELGAQSMNDEVLRQSGRGHTAEDVRRAAKRVKEAGFELVLQVMAGLPGDSRALCRQTAEQIAALAPDAVRIYPVCVLRGSPLAQRVDYRPLSIDQAAEWCADMLEVFQQAQIPVIRLGLNPTEDLAKAVLAGPYHPALGQIVQARLARRQAAALLQAFPPQAHVLLQCPKGQLSTLRGQKNDNMAWFQKTFPQMRIETAENRGINKIKTVVLDK